MPKTEIRGAQIKDTSVQRADLDVSTTGSAVVTRLVAGTNVTFGSTGVDTGTGDVTINSAGILASSTDTLTNKRIQVRSSTATSGDITPALASFNLYQRTAQAATLLVNAPTGTPVLGEVVVLMLKSVTAAQTLTMNATYKVFGAAFPATISTTKRLLITAQYDGTDWLTLWSEEV